MTYQCDHPACTIEGSVYGMCVKHAPPSWLQKVLDDNSGLLTDEQQEGARDRLEAECSA